MKKMFKREKGFTIIEVVLVLAIAGLIFLVVFLALPQLQRSRRDTQRKSDVGRMVSALESYAGNNSGKYPSKQTDLDTFVTGYITNNGSDFTDPSGGKYKVTLTKVEKPDLAVTKDTHPMYYGLGQTCGDTEGQFKEGNQRDVAVMVPLESGTAFCQDNR